MKLQAMVLPAILLLGCHAQPEAMAPESSFDSQACVEQALRGRWQEPALLKEAHRHFEEGCANLEPAACSTLGLFFEHGWVERSDAYEAARLYRFGCTSGNEAACVNLAVLFERRQAGVAQMGMARPLLVEACDAKDARACLELGRSELQRGIAPDAMQHLDVACGAGTGEACVLLAQMLPPTQAQEANAHRLYQQACGYGDEQGCAALDRQFQARREASAIAPVASGFPTAAGPEAVAQRPTEPLQP